MKRVVAEIALAVGLLAGVVGTGVALVTTTHESRSLFRELEELKRERDRLQDDWSALHIEVNTLAGHARIDDFARRELGMVEPGDRLQFVGSGQ
jgi:cell division protein FtsL